MKKLLGIVVLGLLLSGNAYAGWFDKDKIKITKCYNLNNYNSYKDVLKDREHKKKTSFPFLVTKWEWELNLKEKIAYRTVIINNELSINQFKIKIATDDYIIAHDPEGDVQFDLKNQIIIASDLKYGLGDVTHQCRFK
tara:strand:+ start:146 stop:559 length:414 start_codon:yes stop_codon:yes gene_type:complete